MRRGVGSPYPRGEETRARIIHAAVVLFSAKGFDSVSTREIALAAGVPQPSLRYYFETKQGLYVASLEHVQAAVFRDMEAALNVSEALLGETGAGRERMVDSFCALQNAMIDTLVGSPDGELAAMMIIRHDLPSEGGSSDFHGDETAIRRISDCFSRMMVTISGDSLDQLSASRIVGIVNGQITNIYLRRDRLRKEGWEITPDRLRWIKNVIRAHTIAILGLYPLHDSRVPPDQPS